jgi:hypothetical protein
MYKDAMEWLELKAAKAQEEKEMEIIEYIQEMLWQYNDLRNS